MWKMYPSIRWFCLWQWIRIQNFNNYFIRQCWSLRFCILLFDQIKPNEFDAKCNRLLFKNGQFDCCHFSLRERWMVVMFADPDPFSTTNNRHDTFIQNCIFVNLSVSRISSVIHELYAFNIELLLTNKTKYAYSSHGQFILYLWFMRTYCRQIEYSNNFQSHSRYMPTYIP